MTRSRDKHPNREHNEARNKFWAVVPAAGLGRRMKAEVPKQYLEILGKTLMEHTLERLLEFTLLEKLVVALDGDDEYYKDIELLRDPRIVLVKGGEERYHSVMNGLAALEELAEDTDWVMVHDVARPCIRQADLDWLVTSLENTTVGGLLGMPVRDTMKRSDEEGSVSETIDRENLWHALTPQMFRLKPLIDGLNSAMEAGISITDEASAMEFAGYKPIMVEGHGDNIKVTRASDLALASLYLQQQAKLIETA